MITIGIESDVELLIARLEQVPRRVREAMKEKLMSLAERVRDKVIENVSGGILEIKSGQLVRSIALEFDDRGDSFSAFIGPRPITPKAAALELGGKGYYPILPSKQAYLHFFWESKGVWVRTKRVNHPPSRAFGYVKSAVGELRSEMVRDMRRAVVAAFDSPR